MNADEIIRSAEKEGCALSVENGYLKGSKQIPSRLMESLKANKQSIIEYLSRDSKARAAGFMVGVPGELYTLSVSRRADIFIEQINGVWTAYRSTYVSGKAKPIYSKTIATGETMDYVLMKAKGYTQYIDRFRQRKRK